MIRLKRLLEDVDVACPLPTGNACEIQRYLICKGFLTGRKDCDFGDESSRAVGRLIKSKLGIDPKINSLSDLQSYMSRLGIETGAAGFGKQMAMAVADFIALLEDKQRLITKFMQSPDFLNSVQFIANQLATLLKGKQVNVGHDKYWDEDVAAWSFKLYAEYPTYVDAVKINSLRKDLVVLYINMHVDYYVELQDWWTGGKLVTKSGRLDLFIQADMNVTVSVSNGQICAKLNTKNVVVQSKRINITKYWTLSIDPTERGDGSGIMDAAIVLDLGTFMNKPVGTITLHKLQPKTLIDSSVGKPKCETFANLIKKLF